MMSIRNAERDRERLAESLNNTISPSKAVRLITNFYGSIIEELPDELREPYILEFFNTYLINLKYYTPFGEEPDKTYPVLEMTEHLTGMEGLSEYSEIISRQHKRIRRELDILNCTLNGKVKSELLTSKAMFPLLEKSNGDKASGILDSVSVKLSYAEQKDLFHIIPSERFIEESILSQIKESWAAAVKIASRYAKVRSDYHEVVVHFDKRIGFYEGSSLGTALTLSFIEELLRFYNSSISIYSQPGCAYTGPLRSTGVIEVLPEESIKAKARLCFFSNVERLILPFRNKQAAFDEIEHLREKYPDRVFHLTGAEDLYYLLNRRDIVEVKKQNILKRSYRFLINNRAAFFSFILLSLTIILYNFISTDNNPYSAKQHEHHIAIMNEQADVLWTKATIYHSPKFYWMPQLHYLTADINNDEKNEVVLTSLKNDRAAIYCFDYKGEQIWRYYFDEKITSDRIDSGRISGSKILGIIPVDGKDNLICVSSYPSYASALYLLSLENGEKTGHTLWSSGHIQGVITDDINKDGAQEITALAYNNSYEKIALFNIEVKHLYGQTPATDDYAFHNIKTAEFNHFILLPHSDLSEYKGFRMPNTLGKIEYDKETSKLSFSIIEDFKDQTPGKMAGIFYSLSSNFTHFDLVISDMFHVLRDRLVKSGKLNPPYSNTEEYKEILLQQIRYWNGEKFIDRREYLNN